ncbi:oxidoreductase [Glycomyces sp. TRM65418]|uniref:oxidoreductase n=1 Tax=Glycomyces sp. TRM65418 TaxID=2867006 RepID=UPI001CE6D6D9|nr:oxidoreductase [Glycomyces sp. TRM65418]MCC3762911.1 oxidoreductase [Glycomyces sp. TRM65418]QZD56936.1 oxidoreductase [Glycomyces sp. TRM65418]
MTSETSTTTSATANLGRFTVNRIGYGAMQLAGPNVFGPPADPENAKAVLRHAVDSGVDHIDTAQIYGPDVVNDLIREALHPYPEGLVLATKVGGARDERGAWLPAGDPADLKRQVEENLRSLQVERLDLVNLRRFERDHPDVAEPALEDQLAALNELRDEGKIDMIGISNAGLAGVRTAIAAGAVGVQNAFSILDRADDDIVELCREHGIAFVPFFPLGSAFGGGGPNRLAADEHVNAVGRKHDATASQVALAWLLARYERMLLIPGTASIAHLDENLAVGRITLDAEDLARLDEVEPFTPAA